eukprot:GFUD01006178.1.p1 GENE.GFUD01006178.1~~GFUD01006178.1.p1  ORF type:complete len:655 (+),score=165.53 GFUD01006178.1:182-2146(+)
MQDIVNSCFVLMKETNSRMMLLVYLFLTVISNSTISGGSTAQHFLQEPENVRATLGEQIRLPCVVKNKTGECQWTKDGFGLGTDPDLVGFSRYSLDISSNDSCDLILDPVQVEDEGLYQCQVGAVPGAAAITSKSVTVIVNHEPGLPHILQTKHGDVMEVSEGQEIVLECESQGGKPAADIFWKHKDGTKVASEVVDVVTRMDDERLFKTYSILRFVPEKDEEILCTAFSEQFRAPRVSSGVKIRMKHKPRIELEFSRDNLGEGDSFEVMCKAEAYPVNLRYDWFINDIAIVDETSEVLKIENIQRENDQMEIKCRAENEVGSSEAIKVLNLSLQPKMIKHPQTTFGRPDETVTLSCQAEGNPPPRYVWVKSKSNELVGVGQDLRLTVSESTEGEYACKAISGEHQPITSETAKIVMKRKPRLEVQPTKTGVRGMDVLITCKVNNAHPGTKLVWSKKGQIIPENSFNHKIIESHDNINMEISSDLIILKTDAEDFTSYGCFASNELGADYKEIELVEESDYTLTIILIVNIIGGLMIFLIVVIVWRRKSKSNVDFMEQEKMKNSVYLNNQEIFKNVDRSVFDKLLNKNELVVRNDNFNINMEFQEEEDDPEYEGRISSNVKNLKGKLYNIPLSPNDSMASSRTVLSFIADGEEA